MIMSTILLFGIPFIIILMYNRYSPSIDVIMSGNKYIVILWYNKYNKNKKYKRTYIELFKM